MEELEFTHLHVHSEYSLLDGACRIKELPKQAKKYGMKSIALTDHGNMFGAIDFYKECKKNDIKPIIGCEVYVAKHNTSRKTKDPNDRRYNHLILLCKDMVGYKNLCKLVSDAYVNGYYYKPRIDFEILSKHYEGLVCLSGCMSGAIASELLYGTYENAKKIASDYKDLFGDDYYIEIQNNGIPEQIRANMKLIKLAKELNIKVVGTNDTHYLLKEDSFIQDVLLCIQTGKRLTDNDRMKMGTDELYLKSSQEMIDYFENIPQAIKSTKEISDKCNLEFEFGHTIFPNYEVPKEYSSHLDYLKKLCHDGLIKRYGKIDEKIQKRADYEIDIISKMGYVDYYLIVWDFINYAKKQKIPVGPGRGSGAGSILAYAIGITDVDPIAYDLIFERFLNPERISMPDFDVDFCYERRQEVIDYVSRKYGKDHVSQIITFGTMSARMVIRDVSRVLNIELSKADKIAKMIPKGPKVTIQDGLEINMELKKLYETDQETKKIIDISQKLEGMPRQASTHACGIVITKQRVDDYVPLYARDDIISTQYIMTTLEELGLLKMDFLGLRTLTVISDTIKAIKQNHGVDIEFDSKCDDKKVYELWQTGNTQGIFQFESQGMTKFMKDLKPDCLEDLIAGVSLYRPGPMDQIPQYVNAKKDKSKIKYLCPELEDILDVTYGCLIYQEQVMQMVRKLAGYSYGRADLVRRAMGKKKIDIMNKEKDIFINGLEEDGKIVIPGCIRNGIDEKVANKLFEQMAEFAKYAFNKSHAACYATLAYQTAYLKRYYPQEFMASMLNSYIGDLDKVPEYIQECEKLNIKILRPDINISKTKFFAKGNDIYYGLSCIKNIGINIVEKLVEQRQKNGNYKSFEDFAKRALEVGANKKTFEALIKSGALDCFGKNRATLLASYELILDNIQDSQKNVITGQFSIFEEQLGDSIDYIIRPEMTKLEKLRYEKEYLGIYVTGHPLEDYKEIIKSKTNYTSKDIKQDEEILEQNIKNQNKIVGGIITKITKRYTKKNKLMVILTIEDLFGEFEVLCFENSYYKFANLLEETKIVVINAHLSSNGRLSIVLDNVTPIEKLKQKSIIINLNKINETQKQRLRSFIKYFQTTSNNSYPVFVMQDDRLDSCGRILFDLKIKSYLEQIVGNCFEIKD